MCHRVVSSACDEVFMLCRYRRFHSLSCGFMRFHRTTINRFWNLLRAISCFATTFVMLVWTILLEGIAGAMGLTNFLLAFFYKESFFVILIIRINKVNSCQSSSMVEFWLLVFPFLFLSILRAVPMLVHTSGHTWSCLEVGWTFVNLLPHHIYPLGSFSFNRVNFVNRFLEKWLGWYCKFDKALSDNLT